MSSDAPFSAGEIAEHITEMRKAVSDAEDRLNRLRTELEWWETGQQLFGDSAPTKPAEQLPLPADDPPPTNGAMPSLRKRIQIVLGMEPRKSWKTDAVIDELRRREWLPGGDYAEHHVRSMLGQMHRKGQARRMARGLYRLPPEPKEAP